MTQGQRQALQSAWENHLRGPHGEERYDFFRAGWEAAIAAYAASPLDQLERRSDALQRAIEACDQGRQRAENFLTGLRMSGPGGPVAVMIDALQQDFDEALAALSASPRQQQQRQQPQQGLTAETGWLSVEAVRQMPLRRFIGLLESFASQAGCDVDALSAQLLIAECIDRLTAAEANAAGDAPSATTAPDPRGPAPKGSIREAFEALRTTGGEDSDAPSAGGSSTTPEEVAELREMNRQLRRERGVSERNRIQGRTVC